MRASVPHDVDLEDQIVYGLTPIRFGYLVVAVLGAMSLWGLRWLPLAARLVPCILLVMAAVVLAWGRWRGRPVDRLVVDIGIFLRRNYRVEVGLGPRRESVRLSLPERTTQTATLDLAAINAMARRTPAARLEEPP